MRWGGGRGLDMSQPPTCQLSQHVARQPRPLPLTFFLRLSSRCCLKLGIRLWLLCVLTKGMEHPSIAPRTAFKARCPPASFQHPPDVKSELTLYHLIPLFFWQHWFYFTTFLSLQSPNSDWTREGQPSRLPDLPVKYSSGAGSGVVGQGGGSQSSEVSPFCAAMRNSLIKSKYCAVCHRSFL